LRQAGASASQWVEELFSIHTFALINAGHALAALEIEKLSWWALSHFLTGVESDQGLAHADAAADVSVPFIVHVASLLVANAGTSWGVPVVLLVALLWHEFPVAYLNVELVEWHIRTAVSAFADFLFNVPVLRVSVDIRAAT
jgi:hypothetical protein